VYVGGGSTDSTLRLSGAGLSTRSRTGAARSARDASICGSTGCETSSCVGVYVGGGSPESVLMLSGTGLSICSRFGAARSARSGAIADVTGRATSTIGEGAGIAGETAAGVACVNCSLARVGVGSKSGLAGLAGVRFRGRSAFTRVVGAAFTRVVGMDFHNLTDACCRMSCCQLIFRSRIVANAICTSAVRTPAATGCCSGSGAYICRGFKSSVDIAVDRLPDHRGQDFGSASRPTFSTLLRTSKSMVCRTRSYLISLSAVMITA